MSATVTGAFHYRGARADPVRVMLAFINQAAPNIRKKLQKIDRLNEQSLQDLVRAAERVFNHRETPEEREDRIRREEREFRAEENVKIKKSWPRYFLLGLKTKTVSKKGKNWTQKLKKKRQGVSLRKTNVRFVKSLDIGKTNAPRKI